MHEKVLRPGLLLAGPVPPPLHGVAPRLVLGRRWWHRTQRAARKSVGGCCAACGVHYSKAKGRKWLEAHEVYETDYAAGRMTYLETVPLCHYCHNYVHRQRLRSLAMRGKISQVKFIAVIRHGDRVLRAAGLKEPEPYDGPLPPWADWRLIVNGLEYPPVYRTPADWQKRFR